MSQLILTFGASKLRFLWNVSANIHFWSLERLDSIFNECVSYRNPGATLRRNRHWMIYAGYTLISKSFPGRSRSQNPIDADLQIDGKRPATLPEK